MLAGFESGAGESGVAGVIGGNVNGINVRIGKDGFHVVVPLEAQGFSGLFAGGVHIRCAGENGFFQTVEAGLVAAVTFFGDAVFSDTAETNDGISDLIHFSVPCA